MRAGQAMGQAEARGMGQARTAWSAPAIFRRNPVTDPDTPRHIEIRDGDHTIAAAEVMTCQGAGRTARVWLHAAPGHVTPGRRASLVDAVMDLPEVQASARLEATVPLGDTELLERLRQRTDNAVTRGRLHRAGGRGQTAVQRAGEPARSAAQRWPGDLTARSGPAGWPGRCLRSGLGERVAPAQQRRCLPRPCRQPGRDLAAGGKG